MEGQSVTDQLLLHALEVRRHAFTSTVASLIHANKVVALIGEFLSQVGVSASVVRHSMNEEDCAFLWHAALDVSCISVGGQLDLFAALFGSHMDKVLFREGHIAVFYYSLVNQDSSPCHVLHKTVLSDIANFAFSHGFDGDLALTLVGILPFKLKHLGFKFSRALGVWVGVDLSHLVKYVFQLLWR